MNDNVVQKSNKGLLTLIKILAISSIAMGAILTLLSWRAVYRYLGFGSIARDLIFRVPKILFVLYLFVCYRNNRESKLLPIYYALGFTVFAVSSVINIINLPNYIGRGYMRGVFTTNQFLLVLGLLLGMTVYALFAVDAFLKFRLVKVSRVLAVVYAAFLFTESIVHWIMQISGNLYFGIHPVLSLMVDLLLPLAYVLFYFGAVEAPKSAVPPTPVVAAPTPTPAPAPIPVTVVPAPDSVAQSQQVVYMLVPTPVVTAPTPVPAPRQFCSACGTMLQEGVCPACHKAQVKFLTDLRQSGRITEEEYRQQWEAMKNER